MSELYLAVRTYTDQIDEFLSYEGRLWLDQIGGVPIGASHDLEALQTHCLDNLSPGVFKSTDEVILKWIEISSGWYTLKDFPNVHLIRDSFKCIQFAIYPIAMIEPVTAKAEVSDE